MSVRNRRLVFAGASVLAGLSFSAWHGTGIAMLGTNYNPLVYNPIHVRLSPKPKFTYIPNTIVWDETTGYARMTQEILRGEIYGDSLQTFQPYTSEAIQTRLFWWRDRLGPVVLAFLALLFSGSVPPAFVLADLLFPALLAFSLLELGWRLRPDWSFALLVAALVLWFNWYDLLGWVYYLGGAWQEQAIFARTIYPQFSGVVFVFFLIALLELRQRPAARWGGLLALALALNFYTYFYSWTFAIAMVAGLFLAVAVGMDRGWTPRSLKIVAVAVGAALVLSWPVWLSLLRGSRVAQDTFVRGQGEFTHQPDWARGLPCLFFLCVSIVVARRAQPTAWLWNSFWLAAGICLNQQVITGRKLQADHYLAYFIEPLAVVFLCDLAVWQMGQAPAGRSAAMWRRVKAPLAWAVLALGFTQNLYKLSCGAWEARAFHTWDPAFRELVEFLRRPELRQYAFLSNDPYLDEVLPGYLIQKPLRPRGASSPLTDEEFLALHRAGFDLQHTGVRKTPEPARRIRWDRAQVLMVLNRRLTTPVDPSACQALLENQDFVVALRANCAW